MNWRVVLDGDTRLLKELGDSSAHPRLRVQKDKGEYVLLSDDIRQSHSYDQVKESVDLFLQHVNGAYAAADAGYRPLTADIQQIAPDGKRVLYDRVTCAARVSVTCTATVVRRDGTVERTSLGDVVWRGVEAGEFDDAAATALRLLGKGDDWVNLYRIYEIMEADVGGDQAIVRQGWATTGDLELFRRTANSYAAIGDEARHAVIKTVPPANPMGHKTARSLIYGLCRRWLGWKRRGATG